MKSSPPVADSDDENAEGWLPKADGRSKKTQTAPPQRTQRSAWYHLHLHPKGCLFALYRAHPVPPKRPSARALSESPCSPWAILSDGGTRVLLFFNGKLIYMDYYRRFSPGCQRISFFIRSTFPAAPAPARCQRPPCGQSSNPRRSFFPNRPCSARRAGRAPARSRWKNAAPG